MRLIGWMLVLSLFLSSWSTYFQQLQQKQIAFPNVSNHKKGDCFPGSGRNEDIWLEGIDDIPRRQIPYRRCQRKWRKRQPKKQRQKLERLEGEKTSENPSSKIGEEAKNQDGVKPSNSGHSEEATQKIVDQGINEETRQSGERSNQSRVLPTGGVLRIQPVGTASKSPDCCCRQIQDNTG